MQSRQISPTSATSMPPDLATQYALPISKLRGVPFQVRVALKVRRITTCSQLLSAAALHDNRMALARTTKLAAGNPDRTRPAGRHGQDQRHRRRVRADARGDGHSRRRKLWRGAIPRCCIASCATTIGASVWPAVAHARGGCRLGRSGTPSARAADLCSDAHGSRRVASRRRLGRRPSTSAIPYSPGGCRAAHKAARTAPRL